MSQSARNRAPKLAAALIGAATLSAAPAGAQAEDTAHSHHADGAIAAVVAPVAPAMSAVSPAATERSAATTTLGEVIEARLQLAQAQQRYEAIDELTTLWLSLSHREQLGRVVERAEQFINVSLRNQRISELRRVSRALRRLGGDDAALAEMPVEPAPVAQGIDAERFLQRLEEPYRTAVQWSLVGLNHREVAERMGASHAAVRKWAQRLRERLDPSEFD
ncbi:MAG: sigma factor-like helix-turn-helix DNA-binding protein [Myxococcota bacterium]